MRIDVTNAGDTYHAISAQMCRQPLLITVGGTQRLDTTHRETSCGSSSVAAVLQPRHDRTAKEDEHQDRRDDADDLPDKHGARKVTLRGRAARTEREHEHVDEADHRDADEKKSDHPRADGIVGMLGELVVCHGGLQGENVWNQ